MIMKIIYAIVSSDDGTRVTDVLTENHFSVTRLATTGGFLKKGNATLMIGTEAEKVDQAIQLIKDTCGKRQRITDAQHCIDLCRLYDDASDGGAWRRNDLCDGCGTV